MAGAEKLDFEIVTPKGRALAVVVDEVMAPSVDGEFGVLPGHLPLLAALRTGIVTYRIGSENKRCAIGRGFAEAGPSRVSILTDRYIEREHIDPVLVRKELGEVQAKIAAVAAKGSVPVKENVELDGLVQEENWLAAELELYGDPPPATMRPFEAFGPTPGPDDDEIPQESPGDAADGAPPPDRTSPS